MHRRPDLGVVLHEVRVVVWGALKCGKHGLRWRPDLGVVLHDVRWQYGARCEVCKV